MQSGILPNRKGAAAVTEGEALVSREPIHFLYDVDWDSGKVVRKGHPLDGKSIAGKIVVLSAAKGGIANHPAIPALAARGKGPKGLIFYRAKPDIVQGALAADIPIMDGFEKDPTTVIHSGDLVRMDSASGVVEVGAGRVSMRVATKKPELRLTAEEEGMLAGDRGEVTKLAMEMLIKEAEFWGAEDMVDVHSAHVGASTLYADDWAFEWLEGLIAKGAEFRCMTTTNCIGVERDRWREIGFDEEAVKAQARFSELLNKLGAVAINTVAPYLLGNVPRLGDCVAWGESNAVVMANSYFGARANLLSSLGVVMNAITGKVPRYGFALDAYRRGNVLVELRTPLNHETDWDALGFSVNKALKTYDRVPVFLNLPRDQASITNVKRLSSTLPSGGPLGSLGMFHALGITPEARTLDQACQGTIPEDKLVIEAKDIASCYDFFGYEGKVDMVFLGDASTPGELRHLAQLFAGKKVRKGVQVWVYTNAAWIPVCERMGVTQALEGAGCRFVLDQSHSAFGGSRIHEILDGKVVACDRVKAAYWTGSRANVTMTFRPVEDCVRAAITGNI